MQRRGKKKKEGEQCVHAGVAVRYFDLPLMTAVSRMGDG